MSKKKRVGGLFDIDNIRKRIIEENECVSRVREQIDALGKFDIASILSKGLSLTEAEILQLLSAKLTFQGVCNMRKAIQHVPSNITRITAGKSLRAHLIWETFNELCASTNCEPSPKPSVDELFNYTQILERWCSSFLSVQDLTTHIEDKYISPPLSSCTKCDKTLTMHNLPSKATLFTLDGPILCAKVTLECKNCHIQFGVCNYTDEIGTHLYPADKNVVLVEVSNVTYFDINLYRWIPSLRYIK
jgi:hypothetical protein